MKNKVRGLPQENYRLPVSVDFHAFWLLVVLSAAGQIVVLLSGCLPICRAKIHRTTALLSRKRLVLPAGLGYRPLDLSPSLIVAFLAPQSLCILV
jgi:hypothetical protein